MHAEAKGVLPAFPEQVSQVNRPSGFDGISAGGNAVKSRMNIPIAICGMAVRLPGGIATPQQLWDFLLTKRDARGRVPESRYNISAYHSDTGRPGTIKTEYGYFLDDSVKLGSFDAPRFSFSRVELESSDPQHRLMLEVARECFDDAGEVDFRGRQIGCYMGSYGEDWLEMQNKDPQHSGVHRVDGYGDFMLSNRVSYEMDLRGPSMTIRTAFSAALVGLHESCHAIQRGDCEAAIVGGSNLIMAPGMTAFMTEKGLLSPEGSCKTFSADADEYSRGEAITAVYIKPLDAVIRDGNPIRAVIRSTMSNSDGKTPGILHPSTDSQETMIRQAYQLAGITDYSKTVFVECHGTGTATGGPVEVNAVARVFGDSGAFIGSVKPNLGHSEGASGLTSLIKAVLMLENRTIVPNIKFSSPNPKIPFRERKLTVPLEPTPWPEAQYERVSINSFGIGGANAHVMLGSARVSGVCSIKSASQLGGSPQLFVFSANSAASLQRMTINLLFDYFEKPTFEPAAPILETEAISPPQNAVLSPQPLSKASPQSISSGYNSLQEICEKAKLRGVAIQRRHWVRLLFEWSIYVLLVLFVYFVLVGMPLWKGAVWWLYWVVQNKFVIQGGYAIVIGLAALYAFCPLLILFEKDPNPSVEEQDLEQNSDNVKSTALLIPCYKSASIIGPTLDAALKIFPKENIFVIANGNSQTPLDNTEEVCKPYGVNHLWVPIGSKIVAQFVGCYAAKDFENAVLIDDDCLLPPVFPIVSDRLKGCVRCIGYTIKSVGPNSSRGTYCQQAQDLEYKMSGLQRDFFGKCGSATFPHGAISLWNLEFLKATFHEHPGFSVSEDWFFGDACRRLGGRITMCSQVFVETETPSSVFISGSGSRGGFGEMTIFSQRFKRWNFFFVIGIYYDLKYIFTSWKLSWWELGAKLCVFQEVYETLIYLLAPFVFPISFIVRPGFCGMLLGVTIAMYLINVVIFNEIHLRLKKERVDWKVLFFYYTFYKIALTVINVFSCYWSLYKYARYFAQRHPKVIEDRQAVEVLLSLEQDSRRSSMDDDVIPLDTQAREVGRGLGRKLTLTKVQAGKKPERPQHEEKAAQGGWI